MPLPVVFPFFRSSIRSKKDLQDVEVATTLLIIFDEQDKKERLEIFSKILLPFILIEYKNDNFLIFNEFLRNTTKIRTYSPSILEKSKKLMEQESVDIQNLITNIANIKHLYNTPSTLEMELNSICSAKLCRAILNLSRFVSEVDLGFLGDALEPVIEFDTYLTSRSNFDRIISLMNDFIKNSNDLIDLINSKPKNYIEDLKRDIEEIQNKYDEEIKIIKKENEQFIEELEPKREEQLTNLKKEKSMRANELSGKIYDILSSHLQSDVELIPQTLNAIVEESQTLNSYDKIFPHAMDSLKKLEEKTKNVLKSISSANDSIKVEYSKIMAIQKDIEQKINKVNIEIDTKIAEREQLLKNKINEKNSKIKNYKQNLARLEEIKHQCLESIKEKINATTNLQQDLKKLLVTGLSFNLGNLEPDEKINIKFFRFLIPIYYALFKNIKKSTERVFLIPPCILPMEIKKIKNHKIYGTAGKWIAVDPFDQVLVDEIINPLKQNLDIDLLLNGKFNAAIENPFDTKKYETRFYSGLKILFENGYLKKKNYKKAANLAIDFFRVGSQNY
ncbi:MAG: coiled-coil domain-containing protein [Candidatus Helarchaeota archaeon]